MTWKKIKASDVFNGEDCGDSPLPTLISIAVILCLCKSRARENNTTLGPLFHPQLYSGPWPFRAG